MKQNTVHLYLHFLLDYMVKTLQSDLNKTVDKVHNGNVGIIIPTKFTDIDIGLKYTDMSYRIREIGEDCLTEVGDWLVKIEPIAYPTPDNGFMWTFQIEPISSTADIHLIQIDASDVSMSYSLEWQTIDAIKHEGSPVINVDTIYRTEVPPNMTFIIGLNNFDGDDVPPSALDRIIITFNENEFLNQENINDS